LPVAARSAARTSQELGRTHDGRSGLNYAIYHDCCQRTGEGWKFTERVDEVRYEDTTRWRARRPARPGRPRNMCVVQPPALICLAISMSRSQAGDDAATGVVTS
jgi:hypothetical protein